MNVSAEADPFTSSRIPEPAGAISARAISGIVALLAWLVVAAVELVDISNESLLVLVVPFVEAAFWAIAVGATTYFAWRVRRLGTPLAVLTVLIGGLAITYLTNWSVFEPRSYYATHKWGFAQVADLLAEGKLARADDDYYGQPLPRYLADLSTEGRVSIVAHQDGKPVLFLPQFLGIPDDAVGFVYLDGEPSADLLIDLYGYPAYLAEGERLGDGWWFVR